MAEITMAWRWQPYQRSMKISIGVNNKCMALSENGAWRHASVSKIEEII